MQSIETWFQVHQLNERYISALDNDQLEQWPEFFTDDCEYTIIPKENADMGLAVGIIACDSKNMLEDRVTSLRHANIFAEHTYRHMTSGLIVTETNESTLSAESNYMVIQTLQNGESSVYQTGKYVDEIVRTDEGLRYKSRRVIYDTSRVQTLLATPI